MDLSFKKKLTDLKRLMTCEEITSIMGVNHKLRTLEDNLILCGFSLNFPIMAKIMKIIGKAKYLDLIKHFKLKDYKTGRIIHHIGDSKNQKISLILEGNVKLYNFKDYDIELRHEKETLGFLNKYHKD